VMTPEHREALATWPVGEVEANERLRAFLEERGEEYVAVRDFPAVHGTSKLSPYLAIGAISNKMCLSAAKQANHGKLDSGSAGLVHWISELIWREFFRSILIEFPSVCKNKAFKPEADRVAWSYDKAAFQRWCEGKTGFPIVDAGMRQLRQDGWMHNRLRGITSSFLTKDLLIDWRWGEKFFMENQIDGDFASNNGRGACVCVCV
jgi:deoxyribodipyrimidine photo-lyase